MLSNILQVVLGLGLLNVWLVRSNIASPYRGGAADSLKSEFRAYGLDQWMFYLTGALKIGSAALLLAGLWIPSMVLPSAALVVALMCGAVAMHQKIQDPLVRSLPALAMLAMSALLVGLQIA